jgi:glycosyltransferase involved in cell wall biosynthesis
VHPGIEAEASGGLVDHAVLARAGEGFVLAVGRMSASERYKGQQELIEAWGLVTDRIPRARLVLVGDGDDRARLEALAAHRGAAGAVVFAGAASAATLSELYARAALFALPSRAEGFGLVFGEAMAAGLPCVALAEGAPAEIVVDGETGRLAAAAEPEPLAAAIVELLADAALAQRLGRAGRARYARSWSADAFERRLEPTLAGLGAG